jgi:hypothetical protein
MNMPLRLNKISALTICLFSLNPKFYAFTIFRKYFFDDCNFLNECATDM